jgi:2-oxoisovalerate dehydrogenase E2 component (dihydrolipoyl transacylase)
MTIFALPDLGEGLQEAELVAWHVAEGEHVVADQPLVSVETEKAVVEVPSPQAGRIARLLARPGDRVAVGAPLVEFAEDGRADAGTVVGELEPTGSRPEGRVMAAPAVRALARERGVDLSGLTGSGPGRAITREDVERAASAAGASGFAKLRGVRRAMALNMTRAHAEIVPATLWDEADIEGWWSPDAEVTIRLIDAIGAACRAVPALNAWFDGKAMARRLMPQIDLGIAVDTADGLIVPVLRDIANRNEAVLRADIEVLKKAARDRSLAPADLRGPTLTLSNFGMVGGRQAALVIVPPQVAILGAGRVGLAAVPGDSGPQFHPMLPLSLTFDHRVVTGGEAARFMRALIERLQVPSHAEAGYG